MIHVVEEVYENQGLACHCYYIALQGTKTSDAYQVKGLDTHDDLDK